MKKPAIIAIAAVMIFSGVLYSQPECPKVPHKFMEKLNLTDVQKKDVDKIFFETKKNTIAQKAQLATAHIELQQLFKADSPDKAAIEKKLNEIADLGMQMRMIKINAWFSVNKLLTPEQQKTWKKALKHSLVLQRHKNEMVHKHNRAIPPHYDKPMIEQ